MADNTENDTPTAPPTDETNNESEEDQSEEGPPEEANDGSAESESNTPPAVSSLSCWRCENALRQG